MYVNENVIMEPTLMIYINKKVNLLFASNYVTLWKKENMETVKISMVPGVVVHTGNLRMRITSSRPA
jgi:hypothetical protein